MKIACLLTAIAGASAFAPSSQPARATSQLNAADLSEIRGVGPETAGKIVSGASSGSIRVIYTWDSSLTFAYEI